jgi:hypothetical protein
MNAKHFQLVRGIALAILLTATYTASAFYDPTIGRWINRDPIGERGGSALYGFVHNHPTIAYDALGKKCCLITVAPGTFQGPNGEDNSKFGHSILKCDNGAYVSLWPKDDKYPSWDEQSDNAVYSGATKTTTCFPCLDESKVQQWIDANKATLEWTKTYNCSDAVLSAVQASLADKPKPTCPKCGLLRGLMGCYYYVHDLLQPTRTEVESNPIGAAFSFPSDIEGRIKALADNDCNRWKCVLKCPTPNPGTAH